MALPPEPARRGAVISDTHSTLHEALRAVQSEVGTLPKDGLNPHFKSKFTPLDTIVETVGPLLAKHGLTWSAFPCFGPNGEPALRYKLTHAASGDSESETMPLLVQKLDPQGQGSGITYARRYSLTAVLNLVADEDDDGNSASRGNGKSRQATAAPPQPTEKPASVKQRSLIFARAGEAGLPASILANVVLVSSGFEPREFESEEHAENWLRRSLDRLPARLVDPILKNIEGETVPS